MKPLNAVMTTALVVTSCFFLGSSLQAQGWAAAGEAGHRLCDLQADISADNAQNGYIDSDPDDGGWDWKINYLTTQHSDEPSPTNTYGITGIGLLTYLEEEKANRTFRFITAMYDAFLTLEDTPSMDLAPDVVFCVRLSLVDAINDPVYATLGRMRYDDRVAAHGSPLNLAQYVMQKRAALGHDGLIAWELGWLAEAALALDAFFPGEGYYSHAVMYAQSLVDDINDPGGIFQIGDTTEKYYTLGLAFTAMTLWDVGIESGLMSLVYTKLYFMQKSSGAFPWSGQDKRVSHQTTAYAVQAFHRVKFNPSAKDAMHKGAIWLEADQEDNGGWSYLYNKENTQVDSEIMTAMAMVKNWPPSPGWPMQEESHCAPPPIPHENATMIKF